MKHCNNVDGTPNRPSHVTPITFRTPVNVRPSTLWSPIFHAITPDLNAVTPVNGESKTPALLKSLGIQPELDMSWTNAMATPTTSSDLSSHAVAGISALQNPENNEEKASKTLQRRHLFHSDCPVTSNEQKLQNSEMKNSSVPEEIPDTSNVAVPVKKETETQYLLSLLNRSPSKFIYPKPIYIDIKSSGNLQIHLKKETVETSESTSLFLNDHVGSSRGLKKKNSKDICKSLKFEELSTNNGKSSSNTTIHDSEAMDYYSSDPSFGMCADVQQESMLQTATQISALNEQDPHSLPKVLTTTIGITNAISMKLKTSKDALAQAGGHFDQADLDVSKEMSSPLNAQTPYQTNMGFSTASGKNFRISEQAMLRAQAMFDQVDSNVFENHEHINGGLETSSAFSALKTSVPCKIETPPTVSCETPKTSFPGFNMASGKNVSISRKAMVRAQALFDQVSNDEASSSNLEEPSSAKAPQFPIKNETPLSMNCAAPKAPFTGFSLASGKNVQISAQSLARAQAIYDHVDKDVSSPSSETEKEAPLKIQTPSSVIGNIPATVSTGFSTASGKNFNLSKEAMARAQALFQKIDEDVSLPCPLETSSEEAKFTPKTGVSAFKRHKLENVTPKASYAMGVKKPLVSESSIPGARKLFENPVKMEVDPRKGASDQGLENTSSGLLTLPLVHPLPNTPPRSQPKDSVKTGHQDESGDDWVSSPTIGKKKSKRKVPDPDTPSSFFDTPTTVSAAVLVRRGKAREAQKTTIELKRSKTVKVSQKPGSLFLKKKDSSLAKMTWKETAGISTLPDNYPPYQLVNDFGILPSVYLVRSTNASLFSFYAWEHFPEDNFSNNSSGLPIGEFLVVLSDDNTIGIEEITASLLASKHVDPKLIDAEWIRNHYRWIVWKLASMEMRVPNVFARQCLTLLNVLEQLKYRYDLEIDRCQRSALKRIIEQDDSPAKTMILCVADIRLCESEKGSTKIMELTDGWYSIDAPCDVAMMRMIENGKVFVGIKLAISGAELASPGPTTPLEKGSDTFLKISTNSIRRSRWDSKLGFFKQPKPFPVALASILPDGGCVSYTQVTIVRVYPMIYVEKSSQGKSVFHNERHYRRISENSAVRRERMMEKIVEDIEREEDEQERKRKKLDSRRKFNLTDEEKRSRIHAEALKRMEETVSNMKGNEGVPLLKLRVIDQSSTSNSAIISVWNAKEEIQEYLKEKRSYGLYNIKADGLRAGDLQLTAIRNQTRWEEIENTSPFNAELERNVISFEAANKPGFQPLYNELDAVGLVVFVGPEQSKGPFQIAVLSNGTSYLGLKCWSKFEDYALSDIIVPGNFLAFANLQWRPSANKQASNFPFAFIYEGTLVSTRPSSKHLDTALTALKRNLSDPTDCVTEAEAQLSNLLGNGNVTPSAISRIGSGLRRESGSNTPTSLGSNQSKTPASAGNAIANRARLLEKYGTPPALSPLTVTATPLVRQKFKPPARIKPPV